MSPATIALSIGSRMWRTSTGLNNDPPPEVWRDLKRAELALKALEATAPVRLTSGYRSPEVNAKVGGHPRSRHMEGRAIDVKPLRGWTVAQLAAHARSLGLFSVVLEEATWCHCEVPRERRGEGTSNG